MWRFKAVLVLIILMLLVFGVWKYGYLLNNSLARPIGSEDNITRLTTMLAQANLPVVSLENVSSDSTVASLSGGLKVQFSLTKDLSSQVATLQVILSRFRIEGRKVNRIDLRFNNAVVK